MLYYLFILYSARRTHRHSIGRLTIRLEHPFEVRSKDFSAFASHCQWHWPITFDVYLSQCIVNTSSCDLSRFLTLRLAWILSTRFCVFCTRVIWITFHNWRPPPSLHSCFSFNGTSSNSSTNVVWKSEKKIFESFR